MFLSLKVASWCKNATGTSAKEELQMISALTFNRKSEHLSNIRKCCNVSFNGYSSTYMYTSSFPTYTERLGFWSGHRKKNVFSINPSDSLPGTPPTAIWCFMLHFPLHWIPSLHRSHAHAPQCMMFYSFFYFALNIFYSLSFQISVHSPQALHPILLVNMFFLLL